MDWTELLAGHREAGQEQKARPSTESFGEPVRRRASLIESLDQTI
jgi:hypothetical protein